MKAYLGKNIDGERFIRLALKDYTGRDSFVFKKRPTGKPYVENGPCFSYSDSFDCRLCVVSEGEVGADIEKRRDPSKYMGIVKRFFAPDEARAADESNFFELYTAKEAYVKFTQMGIFSGMERFSVLSGKVGKVNIIKFSSGDCICAAASETEKEVEIKWIY